MYKSRIFILCYLPMNLFLLQIFKLYSNLESKIPFPKTLDAANISSPYTAPENGIVLLVAGSGGTYDSMGWIQGNIDGIPFSVSGSRFVGGTQLIPIAQGQVITFTFNKATATFYNGK